MNSPIASPAPTDAYLLGYRDALHHAAFYVHDHCQHGEEHAETIAALKRPDADVIRAALAQLGTGSGAGAQSDSGADSGHATSRSDQPSMEGGVVPIPSARDWLHANLCTASAEWIEGWTACRTFVTQRAALAKVEAKEKTR